MICKGVLAVFGLAYIAAVFIYLTGTFGWFGQERDALSGVFLIPLGLPWNLLDPPERFAALFAASVPLVNLGLIWLICRRFAS